MTPKSENENRFPAHIFSQLSPKSSALKLDVSPLCSLPIDDIGMNRSWRRVATKPLGHGSYCTELVAGGQLGPNYSTAVGASRVSLSRSRG